MPLNTCLHAALRLIGNPGGHPAELSRQVSIVFADARLQYLVASMLSLSIPGMLAWAYPVQPCASAVGYA